MNPVTVALLAVEALFLAILVLGLFRLRTRIGLTPLYVLLGVFQPIQAMLTVSTYVDVAPGWPVSTGTLMFAATLLAMLAVYIREDAAEARKVTYSVLIANFAMTLLFQAAAWQVAWPGVRTLLDLPPELFAAGARGTAVGTVTLVADVGLMLFLYDARRIAVSRHPLVRAGLTLCGVLLFDAVVFTTSAFLGRPDYPALLAGAVVSKLAIGAVFAALLIAYLRWIDPLSKAVGPAGRGRRSAYAATWRDRYEQQADAHARERAQVFERIADAFIALDTDWRYTFVNSRAAHMLGENAESLLGRRMWDVFDERDHAEFARACRAAMLDQSPRDIETRFPPERWFENRIYPSREGLTIYFHDVTERVRQREGLVRRATVHELTGLPNRAGIGERLDALLQGRDESDTVGVLLFNLDRLHHVNDTLGYTAGDAVVREAARRLARWASLRGWMLGSMGGDEFVVLTEGPAAESLPALAREAVEELTAPYPLDSQSVHLTVCTGVSWYPAAGRNATALLEQADLALNLAKQRGRGQHGVFSAARADDVRARVRLVARMRDALAHDRFELHYQPLVDARSGRIVGAEALMRWTDAELGRVPPARFIPIAEDTGAIVRLGDWALRRALADLRSWQAEGLLPVTVSVNVSPVQLLRPEFVQEVTDLLRDAGIPPHLLKLELTETALTGDDDIAAAMLGAVKSLGVDLSLDDFGTGWSSLARLRRLPIDELKIDRSFVEDIGRHGSGEALCRTIIAMGETLRFRVVAEGVETEVQSRFLAGAGCHTLQGFLYGRPVPPAEFAALLARAAHPGEAVPALPGAD